MKCEETHLGNEWKWSKLKSVKNVWFLQGFPFVLVLVFPISWSQRSFLCRNRPQLSFYHGVCLFTSYTGTKLWRKEGLAGCQGQAGYAFKLHNDKQDQIDRWLQNWILPSVHPQKEMLNFLLLCSLLLQILHFYIYLSSPNVLEASPRNSAIWSLLLTSLTALESDCSIIHILCYSYLANYVFVCKYCLPNQIIPSAKNSIINLKNISGSY